MKNHDKIVTSLGYYAVFGAMCYIFIIHPFLGLFN